MYDALDHAHGGEGQWAFGTGFDEPLAGVDTTVPDGIDPADLGEYCLMLGDDALVLAQRLTQWVTAAPELEEEVAIANIALDLLGQARLLLARAGSVGVLGRSADAGHRLDPRRGRAGLLPGPRRVPQHRARRGAQRRLRADDGPAAGRLDRPAGGVRPAARLPRPGAGRDRRQGRQRAGLPPRPRRPLGAAPRRRHRRSRTAARRPASTPSGRCWPTLFTPTDVERRLTAAGRRRRPVVRPRRGARRAHRGARAGDADRARLAGRRRPARPARRARARAGRAARPSCRAWPASTRRRRGDAPMTDRCAPAGGGRDASPTPSCRCSPWPTSACCATSAIEDGTVVVEITPTYTGCPAMGVMRADLVHALHRGRLRRRRRPHRALPRVDHRLDQRRRAAASSPPAASPRPARRPSRAGRPGAAAARADPRGRRPARCAGRRTPRSSASSAPPRARRCAAAAAAGSRSST